jgi:predicted secreted protein with PEFG-CTERM motif
MPEFGTIALVVFAVALVGIIAVTAKSRLTSNNVTPNVGGKTTMSGNVYKLAMVGILGIIIFGGYMAISGYNSDIYPLDRIRGNLDGIITSSDPAIIRDHLVAIQTDLDLVMANIPEITDKNGNVISKNPWLFGTESTNFLRIQNNIDTMFAGLDEISSLSKDNSAYHTGMLDINDRALILKINIMDATPYMYVSPANMMFSVIWIAAIIGIFAMLKRKKENLQKEDEIGI